MFAKFYEIPRAPRGRYVPVSYKYSSCFSSGYIIRLFPLRNSVFVRIIAVDKRLEYQRIHEPDRQLVQQLTIFCLCEVTLLCGYCVFSGIPTWEITIAQVDTCTMYNVPKKVPEYRCPLCINMGTAVRSSGTRSCPFVFESVFNASRVCKLQNGFPPPNSTEP